MLLIGFLSILHKSCTVTEIIVGRVLFMAKTKEPGITKIEGAKGTSYRVQIRIKNGEHLSKNFDNFKEAKDWKRKTIAAVKAGDPYETTQMRRLTVKDLIDRFIDNELKKLRNHKTMLGHLKWFIDEIGYITLNHLREDVIAKCRDKLAKSVDKHGRPRSASTVNRYLCTLGSVIRVAVCEWKLLTSSPLKHIKKLAEPRRRTRFLTKDERLRLLKICKESPCPHLYPITLIAFLTGMRRGEILGLKWQDIDCCFDIQYLINKQNVKTQEKESILVVT
jgi:integrase